MEEVREFLRVKQRLRGVRLALFKFFLVGSSEAPVLEVPFNHLSDLHDAMAKSRFVEGRMVEIMGMPRLAAC